MAQATPSSSAARIIPLGRAVRPHGVPRGGRIKLKIQLFHRGATLFKGRAAVFVRATPSSPFALVELADVPAPLGAMWEQTPALILEFNESVLPPVGSEIGLPREDFPKLDDSEVYICDLIGRNVEDGEGQFVGTVRAVFDIAPTVGGNWNLEVRTVKDRVLEFPLAWVDWKLSTDDKLVVPDVWEWK